MTQREFAEKMGKSQPWLQKILDGENQLRLDDLDDVAAVFNLPAAELIRRKDDTLYELRPTEALCVRAVRLMPAPVVASLSMLILWFIRNLPASERTRQIHDGRSMIKKSVEARRGHPVSTDPATDLEALRAFLTTITVQLGSAAAGAIPDRPLPSAVPPKAAGGRVAD